MIPEQHRADGAAHPSWCSSARCYDGGEEVEHESDPLIDFQPEGDVARTCGITVSAFRTDDQVDGRLSERTHFLLKARTVVDDTGAVSEVAMHLTIEDLRRFGRSAEGLAEIVTVLTS